MKKVFLSLLLVSTAFAFPITNIDVKQAITQFDQFLQMWDKLPQSQKEQIKQYIPMVVKNLESYMPLIKQELIKQGLSNEANQLETLFNKLKTNPNEENFIAFLKYLRQIINKAQPEQKTQKTEINTNQILQKLMPYFTIEPIIDENVKQLLLKYKDFFKLDCIKKAINEGNFELAFALLPLEFNLNLFDPKDIAKKVIETNDYEKIVYWLASLKTDNKDFIKNEIINSCYGNKQSLIEWAKDYFSKYISPKERLSSIITQLRFIANELMKNPNNIELKRKAIELIKQYLIAKIDIILDSVKIENKDEDYQILEILYLLEGEESPYLYIEQLKELKEKIANANTVKELIEYTKQYLMLKEKLKNFINQ
ncbi:NEQ271 [Nanoarchaeum equitans Kin4-M]|uniref:NEQ271 n=1 Tax=Nanoarchaeum equitans (strain Kin4-M) TaxID=228908 RepID=Q74NG4_NANEQ|nr:NEQ271 [Nanoarchaeum equitans Kin4-M]